MAQMLIVVDGVIGDGGPEGTNDPGPNQIPLAAHTIALLASPTPSAAQAAIGAGQVNPQDIENAVEDYLTTNPPVPANGSVTEAMLSSGVNAEIDGKADTITVNSALALKAPLTSPAFTGTPTGITKTHVGLGNVDNTADSAKPISIATQSALDAKQATLVSGTNIKTINGQSILGSGDLVVSGASAISALKKVTTQIINGTAFQDVSGMTFPVVNGQTYFFDFYVVLRSSNAATGHRVSVNCPAGTLDYMRQIPTIANNELSGAATLIEGHATARDSMTVLATTVTANVDLVYRITGSYVCTANGTFALRAASEAATNEVVIQRAGGTYF